MSIIEYRLPYFFDQMPQLVASYYVRFSVATIQGQHLFCWEAGG